MAANTLKKERPVTSPIPRLARKIEEKKRRRHKNGLMQPLCEEFNDSHGVQLRQLDFRAANRPHEKADAIGAAAGSNKKTGPPLLGWPCSVTSALFSAQRTYKQHFSICKQHSATSLQQSLAAKAKAEADISSAPAESLKNRFFIVISKKLKIVLKQKHKNLIWWRPNCKNRSGDSPIVARVGESNRAQ